MCDIKASSTVNKSVRKNRTLIKEASEVEFVIYNSNINPVHPKWCGGIVD